MAKSFECKREEQIERRIVVNGTRTVYSTMNRLLEVPNTRLAEYIQTELVREGLLEVDGKGGFQIPEGFVFILGKKWDLRFEQALEKWGKIHITYNLNQIIKEQLKPQEQMRTRNHLDALKNELEFERAILNGNKEEVRSILKHTTNEVKHLRFINVIRRITEKESVCINGKTISGFWAIRQIFTKNVGEHEVQIDFLGDAGIAQDLVAYDLFGDIKFLRNPTGDYRLGWFNSDGIKWDVVWYFTRSGNRMDIKEGEKIMVSENGIFLERFLEKKAEPIKPVEKKEVLKKWDKTEKKPVVKKPEILPKASEKKWKIQEHEYIQKWEDKNLKEREEIFLEEFGPFIDAISKTYGIPRNHLLSLIERESSFDPSTDENPLSFGPVQLTKSVFDDMQFEYKIQERNKKTKKLEIKIIGHGGRGYLYIDLFLKTISKNPDLLSDSLINKIPDENTKKQLKKIGEFAKKGVNSIEDKTQYDKMIRGLYRLAHTDDYTNILIWAITYEGLRKEWQGVRNGKIKDVFGINTSISHDLSKIKDSTLVKFVMQWEEPTKEKTKEILRYKKEIIQALTQKKNEKIYLDFYSLYRYNGDTKLEAWENLPQKLYFAMSIMIKERLKNKA